MKKIGFLMCLCAISCTNDSDIIISDEVASNQEVKSVTYNVSPKAFFVPFESAKMYASSFHFNKESVARPVDSVLPFANGIDTLMYLVNYSGPNKGWIAISADARLKPILAISETGSMSKEEIETGCYFSLNEYMGITKALKSVSEGDTLSATYTMWQNMKLMSLPINKRLITRQPLPPDVEIPDFGPGGGDGGSSSGSGGGTDYYDKVLIDSWVEYTSTKKVDKLTATKWGQRIPWNQRVPRVGNTEEHCVAGCVAVAGAQLFYSLHDKLGKPEYIYTEGGKKNWTDGVDKSYFTNRSTNWAIMAMEKLSYPRLPKTYQKINMQSDYYNIDRSEYLYPAILIAYVGDQVSTHYGKNSSSAEMKDIGNALDKLGVSSNYSGYDEIRVKETLDNGTPVCVSAYRTKRDVKIYPFTVQSYYEDGHAWLIDGYKDIKCVYKYKYAWVNSETVFPQGPVSEADYYSNCYQTTTSVPSEVERTWNMNFGWADSYSDATFSMDNDIWQVIGHDDDGNEIEYNYRYKKRILHNFKITE